jgi:cytochrome c55X
MVNLPILSRRPRSLARTLQSCGVSLLLGLVAHQVHAQAPDAARQRELIRMVRQDCGSCHGLYLTASTIYGGRPGTPMAPWKAMLSEAEALWIAQQLMAGFPEPEKDSR